MFHDINYKYPNFLCKSKRLSPPEKVYYFAKKKKRFS